MNISLTSVEMLWKVADFTITSAASASNTSNATSHNNNSNNSSGVLVLQLSNASISGNSYIALIMDLMLKQLFQLSMDPRPLIRHCAMNTLFSGKLLDAFVSLRTSECMHNPLASMGFVPVTIRTFVVLIDCYRSASESSNG